MGRGLSDLQKTILRLALRNRNVGDGGGPTWGVDVLHSEVLVEHFGWHGETRNQWGNRIQGGNIFDRLAIGPKAYASARAALSRAVARLEQRGLAVAVHGVTRWAGATLTDAGVALAEQLSANKVATGYLINR